MQIILAHGLREFPAFPLMGVETYMASNMDQQMSRGITPEKSPPLQDDQFISAATLARRWNCSRSSAYRLARENFRIYALGTGGRNSMLRFSLRDVEAFEAARRA